MAVPIPRPFFSAVPRGTCPGARFFPLFQNESLLSAALGFDTHAYVAFGKAFRAHMGDGDSFSSSLRPESQSTSQGDPPPLAWLSLVEACLGSG